MLKRPPLTIWFIIISTVYSPPKSTLELKSTALPVSLNFLPTSISLIYSSGNFELFHIKDVNTFSNKNSCPKFTFKYEKLFFN